MNFDNPPFDFTISEDKQSVSITEHGITTAYSLGQLKERMAWLGIVRAQLLPAVERGIPKDLQAFWLDHLECVNLDKTQTPLEAGALLVGTSVHHGHFQFPASAEFCRGLAAWLTTAPVDNLSPDPSKLN